MGGFSFEPCTGWGIEHSCRSGRCGAACRPCSASASAAAAGAACRGNRHLAGAAGPAGEPHRVACCLWQAKCCILGTPGAAAGNQLAMLLSTGLGAHPHLPATITCISSCAGAHAPRDIAAMNRSIESLPVCVPCLRHPPCTGPLPVRSRSAWDAAAPAERPGMQGAAGAAVRSSTDVCPRQRAQRSYRQHDPPLRRRRCPRLGGSAALGACQWPRGVGQRQGVGRPFRPAPAGSRLLRWVCAALQRRHSTYMQPRHELELKAKTCSS